MEVTTASPKVEQQRATLTELLMADQPPRGGPEGDDDRRQRAARARPPLRASSHGRAAPAGPRPRDRRLQPGHRRQPRRLHPVRPLRARLRRHPGQRRDRPLRQGLRDPDRVRPERPDGRVDLRHLRRVRRRLPDRRARQQADPRASRSGRASELKSVDTVCPYCGVGCALTYHVDDERERDRLRRGPRAAGQRRAGCASRAATAGTTPPRRSASPRR